LPLRYLFAAAEREKRRGEKGGSNFSTIFRGKKTGGKKKWKGKRAGFFPFAFWEEEGGHSFLRSDEKKVASRKPEEKKGIPEKERERRKSLTHPQEEGSHSAERRKKKKSVKFISGKRKKERRRLYLSGLPTMEGGNRPRHGGGKRRKGRKGDL